MYPDQTNHPWYALQIRSRHERIVASTLHAKGYEVFLPLSASRRQWSDRVKELDLPLFPGYLFCRLDLQKRLPILVTPGVLNVVGVGKTLLPVEDAEIAAIQAVVISRLDVQPWPYMRVGQMVRIERGPLTGLKGILVATDKPYRLVVSVTLLQRSISVEIDYDWVSLSDECLPARGVA